MSSVLEERPHSRGDESSQARLLPRSGLSPGAAGVPICRAVQEHERAESVPRPFGAAMKQGESGCRRVARSSPRIALPVNPPAVAAIASSRFATPLLRLNIGCFDDLLDVGPISPGVSVKVFG